MREWKRYGLGLIECFMIKGEVRALVVPGPEAWGWFVLWPHGSDGPYKTVEVAKAAAVCTQHSSTPRGGDGACQVCDKPRAEKG